MDKTILRQHDGSFSVFIVPWAKYIARMIIFKNHCDI